MKTIQELTNELNHTLETSISLFDKRQGLRFDWLRTISLEVEQLEDPKLSNNNSEDETENNKEEEDQSKPMSHIRQSIANSPEKYKLAKQEKQNENIGTPINTMSQRLSRSECQFNTPIPNSPGFKFVDDDILANDSSSESSVELNNEYDDDSMYESQSPYTLSASVKELTLTAHSFREQWREIVDEKKKGNSTPQKPFKFGFEEENEVIPDQYQISDDSEEAEFDDEDEIYQRNPIEIHGKLIPAWARGEMLEKNLQRQSKIDPDTIFPDIPQDLNLEEIFNVKNPKWNVRHESDVWENETRISLTETRKPKITNQYE